jgi:hypothetical protein
LAQKSRLVRGQMIACFRSHVGRFRALQVALLVSGILAPLGAAAGDKAPDPTDHAPASLDAPPSNDDNAGSRALTGPAEENEAQGALCLMVESAARANSLPVGFFARVIWQESHFQAQAVGPLTHTGQRARGIAQFMPNTARERGLLDPFNPVQALPKAAEFLAELRRQFGNLGLAAAAYNAGPGRVREWLAGTGGMPAETRNYVVAITGRALEDWAATREDGTSSDNRAEASCSEVLALLKREPSLFVSRLENGVARAVAMPWGVQVATGFNRDQALAAYARVLKEFEPVFSQQNPTLEPILFRSRGTSSFYQVRIGANTRREAEHLCKQVRLVHGACLVKRRNG